LRLFTAIDIPPEVKARLAALVDRLRHTTELRWIPLEKLHITTKFIGEWPEDRLDELKRTLATIKSPGPVEIVIRGLIWLPNARNPRALCAAVEPNEDLARLAERPDYRPHVTLARLRKTVILPEVDFQASFWASSFALYLSAAGKYTKLQEFPFT
jgi:2'-5' RNA ligase